MNILLTLLRRRQKVYTYITPSLNKNIHLSPLILILNVSYHNCISVVHVVIKVYYSIWFLNEIFKTRILFSTLTKENQSFNKIKTYTNPVLHVLISTIYQNGFANTAYTYIMDYNVLSTKYLVSVQ